jgi:uncharacterized protein (DUF302 family)
MIMASLPENGMAHLSSPRPVSETLQRLESLVTARGLTILARIDHSGDAAKVGLKMAPTELLIFGKAGTPVMIASPTTALDLPLKALVWQDANGKSGSLTTARNTSSKGTTFRMTC